MSEIFGDMAGWACLVNPREPFHILAKSIYRKVRQQRETIVTTNYVLAELVSLLLISMRLPHATVVGFINDLKASPLVEIVHIDPDLDAEAWNLFQRRPDKRWSLIDCASFVVMQKRGINEALTTDVNFEQAGFIRLLK